MLSTAAFNALLKTLEEPPPHAIFVLATTEIHKIPATVLSRCQRHEFRRIPVERDRWLAETDCQRREDQSRRAKPSSLIARQSTGSLRDAISLLDQLASTGDKIDLALTQTVLGTATSTRPSWRSSRRSIRDHQPAAGLWMRIHSALDAGS
jgi:DNA polymerase III subunit gamma/tau